MRRSRLARWLPVLMGGGGEAAPTLELTLTGGSGITFAAINVSAGKTLHVDWGDGNANDYTGSNLNVTHSYPGVGTYSIKMSNCEDITKFDSRNGTLLSCSAGQIGKLINCVDLRISHATATGLIVAEDELAALTKLEDFILVVPAAGNTVALQTEFSTTVDSIRYEAGLTESQVDAILAALYADRAKFTAATHALDIAGTSNAAPSGAYQDSTTPSTGLEHVYKLANDPDAEGFKKWTITYEGGVAP